MKHLGIKEIEEILPHRHPFLLIDYIEDYEPGEFAAGYKYAVFPLFSSLLKIATAPVWARASTIRTPGITGS